MWNLDEDMLKVNSLSFKIWDKFLIEDISLEFLPGQIHGLLGPNGSGKTTLLKVIAGIWKATSGTVLWNDANLLALDRRMISCILSLVPQNPQVHFDFSVREVVEMGTYPRSDLNVQKKIEITDWALELVDMQHLQDRCALRISHGERQRMYIARSLVTQSPILMLDEPTSNLDIRHQLEIWELLRRLSKENKLIIVANHDLSTAENYCDQITVLNHGHCVTTGSFSTIMTPDLLLNIFGVASLPTRTKYAIY